MTSAGLHNRSHREEGEVVHMQKPEKVGYTGHVSVLLEEVLTALAPQKGEYLVDCTAGEGGHSQALLAASEGTHLLALDADPAAAVKARARLERFGARAKVVESNFGSLGEVLQNERVSSVHKVLFDLGWNSGQMLAGRGFSFMGEEPLNMSYGNTSASGVTAADILNEWSEETIATILYGFGEERYSRRIARAIVARRDRAPFVTTSDLVETVRTSVPAAYRNGRINCATRTFQALRMAVNDELGVIDRGIKAAWEALVPGGRIAVITFHSIEDRAVKQLFRTFADSGGELVYKKPLSPTKEEIAANPRSRSAKLRVIQKTNTL